MKRGAIIMTGLLVLTAAVCSHLSWGQIGFSRDQSMDSAEALKEARARKAPAAPGILAGDHPSAGEPRKPIEFVSITGGIFRMGTNDSDSIFRDARPVHEVTIKTFEMSKTLVTVAQYNECVVKGVCTEPDTGPHCNWRQADRQLDPVNCVDWEQANRYAKFKGARLPSESEWEYAATSGGKKEKYPWGNDAPTCNKAVMKGDDGYGCGSDGTMPVCSKPAGNTAQGLCDMVGNVWEWVQDTYQASYTGAPTDGAAFEAADSTDRVLRGSSWDSGARYLRSAIREGAPPSAYGVNVGFRLARSVHRRVMPSSPTY